MPSFLELLKEKNDRLNDIPLKLQTVAENQQRKVLNEVLMQLGKLDLQNGQIKINAKNIKLIGQISDELKGIFTTDEYLKAVKNFSSEFVEQANINAKLIKKGFGESENPLAAQAYVDSAKRNAVNMLTGSAIDKEFTKPITGILEAAVVNGASVNETIDSIRGFIEGTPGTDTKILKYVKQITNDSFAIADRSYTSIVSDYLGAEWFYFSGTKVDGTRCFCDKRVGRYFHYKEIESWANGENIEDCDIGGGKWAGEIPGTNTSTIYSYLGGYNCLHSLMPVSIAIVPDEDIKRAKDLGFIN